MDVQSISTLIEEKITEGIFPGAVVALLEKDTVIYHAAFGQRIIIPKSAPMFPDTLFDLASLTKPIVIGTLSMQMVASGDLSLDTPAQIYLPEFKHPSITCRQLLIHTSGLSAWKPLYIEADCPDAVIEYFSSIPLESTPGEKVTYSCLGYILMGILISTIAGESLDTLAVNRIFKPLDMKRTFYNLPSELQDNCAATEDSNSFERRMVNSGNHGRYYRGHTWREGVILGEVHDENANFLGGVSGNAGLFSNARDLVTYCQMVLKDDGSFLSHDSLIGLATPYTPNDASEHRSIGWHILNDGSLYHTGFTGTSIRIDIEKGMAAILLTNRVHPDAQRTGIIDCRNQFHRLVFG